FGAMQAAKAEARQCATSRSKILLANRAANGEKGSRERRGGTGELCDRYQKRQSEVQVLAHVAVPGQHQSLAPVAGIGETVVRAAAIHPDLTLPCVVMRQREMRRAVAKRFAHLDALGVERVGDPADGALRSFLVDVPTLEMFDRAGI